MVNNIAVDLNNDIANENNTDVLEDLEANKKLYDVVTLYKNKITHYYQNKTWDKYKKLTNEYELIFTSPNASHNVSKYSPVSRSFFKLWELLHEYKKGIFHVPYNEGMKCLFLAEGPGGFAEAMMKYRCDYFNEFQNNDFYCGISLKSNNNKNIPEWKFKNIDFNVCYGKDGTGNLYNIDNIDDLCQRFGENSFDFITADGGFDFSADFNCQEEMSLRLLTCELYAILKLQKLRGSMVVKVFDIFTKYSLNILSLISDCYETVKIIKPLTSRPANSEKYILCMGYKGCPQSMVQVVRDVVRGRWPENGGVSKHQEELLEASVFGKNNVIKNLILFNTFYISRQVKYIQKTIEYINTFQKNPSENGSIKKIIDDHVEKVKAWCIKYDIPV